jgi:hypothetical protein
MVDNRPMNTCVICSEDYPEDEMFWVDEEPGMPDGFYCYECDANLVIGDRE